MKLISNDSSRTFLNKFSIFKFITRLVLSLTIKANFACYTQSGTFLPWQIHPLLNLANIVVPALTAAGVELSKYAIKQGKAYAEKRAKQELTRLSNKARSAIQAQVAKGVTKSDVYLRYKLPWQNALGIRPLALSISMPLKNPPDLIRTTRWLLYLILSLFHQEEEPDDI